MRWNGGGGGEGVVSACFPGKGKSEDGSRWTKPVAVLTGPRIMSSGDSVAFWFRNKYRHELFGEHTSGASGPKGRFELPSGFATVGYVRSHWKSRSLEGIGVAPTVPVLQDVVELSLGIDSVLAAAEKYLKKVAR
jgi:C-terminal processing protease CtpA/Prc